MTLKLPTLQKKCRISHSLWAGRWQTAEITPWDINRQAQTVFIYLNFDKENTTTSSLKENGLTIKGSKPGSLVKPLVNLKIKTILLKTHDAEVKSEVWDVMCSWTVLWGNFTPHTHTHQVECVHQAPCILSAQGGPPPQPVWPFPLGSLRGEAGILRLFFF